MFTSKYGPLPMSEEFVSVEQVSDLLGLHVKTVRAYVREGRLKAVRIGKQYRIARKDLEAFTGGEPLSDVIRNRHVEVSTIVHVDAVSVETANRTTTSLMAAAKGRPPSGTPLRIDTIYDEERAHLKVIFSGGIQDSTFLLGMLGIIVEP